MGEFTFNYDLRIPNAGSNINSSLILTVDHDFSIGQNIDVGLAARVPTGSFQFSAETKLSTEPNLINNVLGSFNVLVGQGNLQPLSSLLTKYKSIVAETTFSVSYNLESAGNGKVKLTQENLELVVGQNYTRDIPLTEESDLSKALLFSIENFDITNRYPITISISKVVVSFKPVEIPTSFGRNMSSNTGSVNSIIVQQIDA